MEDNEISKQTIFIFGMGSGMSILVLLMVMFGESTTLYKSGFKDGQIEALTGKVKYELVVEADTTWKEKK